MTIPASLTALAGQWRGTNKLWLDPSAPPAESETTLTVATTAQGKYLTCHYTWAFEGQPQDGLLLIGRDTGAGAWRATLVDSFHTGDGLMDMRGPDGEQASVAGSYAAPPGPDWGWQVAVTPLDDGRMQLVMRNVAPTGEVYPAVEATYARAA